MEMGWINDMAMGIQLKDLKSSVLLHRETVQSQHR